MNEEEFKILSTLTPITKKWVFIFNRAGYELVPPTGTELMWCLSKLIENNYIFCQLFINPVAIHWKRFLYIPNHLLCSSSETSIFCCSFSYDPKLPIDSIQELSVIFSFSATMHVDTNKVQCEEWSEEVFRNILLL